MQKSVYMYLRESINYTDVQGKNANDLPDCAHLQAMTLKFFVLL